MNLIDFVTFKVIVDYGHNTPAVKAMGRVLPHLTKGQKIVVAHGTGTRVDTQIQAFGAALSDVYDKIILADADPRGREPGETSELVRSGALDNGFATGAVEIVDDPDKALARAFEIVQPGDLIVVQVNEVEPVLQAVMAHFARIAGARRDPGGGAIGDDDLSRISIHLVFDEFRIGTP